MHFNFAFWCNLDLGILLRSHLLFYLLAKFF